ncbi:NAD(P)-binding domain-containing protein [Amycolatopsis mediterranei]|uniref:NADPH-dependent F420 reductase n=1 Tax=Amycolatopsis mediterranei TaxID=33910 RepID=UPI003438C456
MRIAIIGTGKVGSALGARLTTAGHDVAYGSRTPGNRPGPVSHTEAVRGAELVITAIPGTDVVPTLEKIGEDLLADRIVLDPSAALTPELALAYPNDSVAQRVQSRFPRARVVKALNTMNFSIMIDPLASLPHATVFVSGDDDNAKRAVKGLLADLGWPTEAILDLGDVSTATATEHAAPLFFATHRALQTLRFAIAIAR